MEESRKGAAAAPSRGPSKRIHCSRWNPPVLSLQFLEIQHLRGRQLLSQRWICFWHPTSICLLAACLPRRPRGDWGSVFGTSQHFSMPSSVIMPHRSNKGSQSIQLFIRHFLMKLVSQMNRRNSSLLCPFGRVERLWQKEAPAWLSPWSKGRTCNQSAASSAWSGSEHWSRGRWAASSIWILSCSFATWLLCRRRRLAGRWADRNGTGRFWLCHRVCFSRDAGVRAGVLPQTWPSSWH